MLRPYETRVVEIDGVRVKIEFFYDEDSGPPWKEEDGHGPVRAVRKPHYGPIQKRPGEVLISNWHDDAHYAYDVQAAQKLALKDGWGAEGETPDMTPGQKAAHTVQADIAFLRGYIMQDWYYVGVRVVVEEHGKEVKAFEDSCWGFETYKNYHEEAADEMARVLARRYAKELAERAEWAARDVVTI